MRVIVIICAAAAVSACGARILEVKTKDGGFCLVCLDKPDRATSDALLKGAK